MSPKLPDLAFIQLNLSTKKNKRLAQIALALFLALPSTAFHSYAISQNIFLLLNHMSCLPDSAILHLKTELEGVGPVDIRPSTN